MNIREYALSGTIIFLLEYCYAEKDSYYPGYPLLGAYHMAAGGLHRHCPCLPGVDGENPTAACPAGGERGCPDLHRGPDAALRTYLLLCHLPPGSDAGCHCLAAPQEEQVQLQPCEEHVEIRRAGCLWSCPGAEPGMAGGAGGSLQYLRTYRGQCGGSPLQMGQQPAGSVG